jgi:hypothetical protein
VRPAVARLALRTWAGEKSEEKGIMEFFYCEVANAKEWCRTSSIKPETLCAESSIEESLGEITRLLAEIKN